MDTEQVASQYAYDVILQQEGRVGESSPHTSNGSLQKECKRQGKQVEDWLV